MAQGETWVSLKYKFPFWVFHYFFLKPPRVGFEQVKNSDKGVLFWKRDRRLFRFDVG